jgi:hypothetical protein
MDSNDAEATNASSSMMHLGTADGAWISIMQSLGLGARELKEILTCDTQTPARCML